jgi:hypothetical protein
MESIPLKEMLPGLTLKMQRNKHLLSLNVKTNTVMLYMAALVY